MFNFVERETGDAGHVDRLSRLRRARNAIVFFYKGDVTNGDHNSRTARGTCFNLFLLISTSLSLHSSLCEWCCKAFLSCPHRVLYILFYTLYKYYLSSARQDTALSLRLCNSCLSFPKGTFVTCTGHCVFVSLDLSALDPEILGAHHHSYLLYETSFVLFFRSKFAYVALLPSLPYVLFDHVPLSVFFFCFFVFIRIIIYIFAVRLKIALIFFSSLSWPRKQKPGHCNWGS